MTNTFMAEFYATDAADKATAKKVKDNLAAAIILETANFRPTPTTAELNTMVTSGSSSLSGSLISAAKKFQPHAAELFIQRKFPIRS